MRYYSRLTCMLILLVLVATPAAAQDRSYLDPSSLTNRSVTDQDIKETVGGESSFNPSQDTMGSATPVLTGKNTPAATVNTNPAKPTARLTSPLIHWHLDLRDDVDSSVDLNMSQSGEAVFGTGSIVAGDVVRAVAATGNLAGQKLSLDILSMDDLVLYRFDLTLHGKSLSGDYHAFSSSLVPRTGIAMGDIMI